MCAHTEVGRAIGVHACVGCQYLAHSSVYWLTPALLCACGGKGSGCMASVHFVMWGLCGTVWGLCGTVWGLGCTVWGLGGTMWGLGCTVWGLGCTVWGLGGTVWGSGGDRVSCHG